MTPEILKRTTDCSITNSVQFAPWLSRGFDAYQINTPERQAAFLAQVGHESGSLRYVSELWGPTDAQKRYEGRKDLGNIYPGDGSRYRGHGLIQVTGRANHAGARDGLRKLFPECPDFEVDPLALTTPQWAALSACWFWGSRNLNAFADAGDFVKLTKSINGGTNGLEDRMRRWEQCRTVLGCSIKDLNQ